MGKDLSVSGAITEDGTYLKIGIIGPNSPTLSLLKL